MAKSQEAASVQTDGKDVKELQKKVKELEAQLPAAEVKAEVYDRMIEMAEAKFDIPIRKKLAPSSRDLHANDHGRYQVRSLCGLLGVSKQTYYQYDEDSALAKAAREEFALQYIMEIRRSDPGIGGQKLWHMYRIEFGCDFPIGRDRFCRIIDEHGLKVRLSIRKPRTTDSTHGLPTHTNLVKELIPTAPNQLWVSDITYIVIMDDESHCHFCHLSMVFDAYSEEIVG